MNRKAKALGAAALSIAMLAAMPQASDAANSQRVKGLQGPRGIAIDSQGKMYVGQEDGTIVRVFREGPRKGELKAIGKVPQQYIAPAVADGPNGTVFALTAGADSVTKGAGTLYRFKNGHRKMIRNIQAFQRHDADPYDLEELPNESNPFGLAALPNGKVLVADAAGNDLLKVGPKGRVTVVARVKPRMVDFDLPQEIPLRGSSALTRQAFRGVPQQEQIPAEAVVTSVTVGSDGAYYIGELRGFPATPGTSAIWRIKPGAKNAVCDPEHPRRGDCKMYVDGLTSIVDLAAGPNGEIYATELSKASWMAMESPEPSPEAFSGAVIKIFRDKSRRTELRPGKLTLPGGVAVGRKGGVYATAPVFSFVGPGAVIRMDKR